MENKGILSSKRIIVFITIIVLLFAILPGQITDTVPLETSLLFFVIAMFSVVGIMIELNYAAFTLNMIHWIFTLIFFFIAPLIQSSVRYSPWEFSSAANDHVIRSCFDVILWILFYITGNIVGKKLTVTSVCQKESISSGWLYMLTFISLICGISIVVRYGFFNLFSRADMVVGEDAVQMSRATALLWTKISRATIVCTETMLILTAIKKEIKVTKLLYVNTLTLLLTCFPLALARNEAAVIYLGLFVIFFYRDLDKFRRKPWYILCFLGATIAAFPVLDIFRSISFYNEDLTSAIYNISTNLQHEYLTVNYDAFSMIESARSYIKAVDITYGYQLLGAVFFFVPRTIWASKPVGSGTMIADFRGQRFTNISCPLIGEGYVNFGILGMVLFAFVFGVLSTVIDRKYWENTTDSQKISFVKIVYPFLLPYYFFMLRGDLMSSLAYTLSYVVTFWFLFKVSNWHLKVS